LRVSPPGESSENTAAAAAASTSLSEVVDVTASLMTETATV